MTSVVADTHALIWYLLDDPRLSRAASAALDETTVSGGVIYLPTICLVEATYLVEKVRVVEAALLALDGVLSDDASPIQPVPLTVEIAKSLRLIQRTAVPDLPDRVIAATALALALPLITADRRIRASGIETIW